jgi:hypothetical protein
MMKILLFIFLCLPRLLWASDDWSKETHHLIEFVIANTHSDEKDLTTFGIEYEFFPEVYHRHFSIGISTDIEWDSDDEYYIGPLFTYYPIHEFKIFYSIGPFWNSQSTYTLQRIGIGYEHRVAEHDYIVPTFNYDFVNDETHIVLGVGYAHTF